MDLGGVLPAILVTLTLLLLNAFFVAAEFALVRVRVTQLDALAQEGSARARLGRHLSDRIDRYLSACQVGITGASLALGWVGEPAIAALLRPALSPLAIENEALVHVASFVVAFGLITYLHIVVGEQAPKYFAIQRALPTTLWSAYPLHAFYRLMYPFIWLVNASANTILARAGVKSTEELEAHSEEELKLLVAVSTRKGILQESERELVGNALDFADRLVRQIMVPRTEIVGVAADMPIEQLREFVSQRPFTRYPVYVEDLDHVVGLAHIKDVFANKRARLARELMRVIPVFPETLHLDAALTEFRRQRAQMALVLDEFGGTAGIVTTNDVIAEVVGEVNDEFTSAPTGIREEAPGVYLIDGLLPLDDLRDRLGLELPDDESYDTVGGMVFGRIGRLAQVGDTADIAGLRFQVTAIDGRRISTVRAQGPVRPAGKTKEAGTAAGLSSS